MGYNNVHLSVDDMFVYWSDILGEPKDSKKLRDYVNGLMADMKKSLEDELFNGLDEANNANIEHIKDLLSGSQDLIDPFAIKYRHTTVGDALDELMHEEFDAVVPEDYITDKGRRLLNYTVGWTFNKEPKSLIVEQYELGDKLIDSTKLEPDAESITFPEINKDTTVKIIAEDNDGCVITKLHKIIFKDRYYTGVHGSTKITNSKLIHLHSGFMDKDLTYWYKDHDCSHGTYIYFAVPNNIHRKYEFLVNGLKDNDWELEVRDIENAYNHFESYRIYRKANKMHAEDIIVEVHGHDYE